MFDLSLTFLSQLIAVIPQYLALILVFKLVHYFAMGD